MKSTPAILYTVHGLLQPRFVYFYPIFHCSLYCRAVSVTDNLCTKQGNSSIFGSKIRGLSLRAVSNQERIRMVWYGIKTNSSSRVYQ